MAARRYELTEFKHGSGGNTYGAKKFQGTLDYFIERLEKKHGTRLKVRELKRGKYEVLSVDHNFGARVVAEIAAMRR